MADTSEKEFLAYAQEQVKKHGANGKISSAQKLASPYVLRKYTTWGELLRDAQKDAERRVAKPVKKKKNSEKIKATMSEVQAQSLLTEAQRDAEYYKNEAEDINNTAQEREAAKTRYNQLQNQIDEYQNQLNIAKGKSSDITKKEKTKTFAEINKEYQSQYNRLKDQYNALLDPEDPEGKGSDILKKMDSLVSDYQKAYAKELGTPISLAVAKAKLAGTDLSVKLSEAPVTLEATKTAEKTAAGEKKISSASGKPTSTGSSIVTGAMPSTPTGGGTARAGAGFNPAKVRMGEEASMGGTPPSLSGIKPGSKFEDLIKRTEFWYNLPDYIFKVNPKLQEILVKAVDEGWTDERFLAAAQQTPWWQQNSASIRTRIVDKAKYDELRAQGLDVSKTDYALDSRSIRSRIKGIAQQKGANLSEEQLDQIVSQAYNGFLENDTNALTQLIAPYIGMVPAILKGAPGVTSTSGITSTYSGEALKNYQFLQDIARKNGFKIQDILPNVSAITTGGNLENAVLQKLATGELDVNAIAQNARILAAAGQPQYVRDLLNQGYDLQDVYAPYRKIMSNVLELNPDQIDLNDPTLRMGITDKGDLNLYEYQKALRKDNRWQYTQQANTEVSNSVKQVLQDFGFMG